MSEAIKRPETIAPESYKPKVPALAGMMENAQSALIEKLAVESGLMSLTIEKCGPYRFIGKSVYARAFDNKGSREIFDGLWEQSAWIFEELDKLAEYASDEPHNAALRAWDMYGDQDGVEIMMLRYGKTELLGYTVGRFMKADTPVPEGMDYIDIPEIPVAKGWMAELNDESEDKVAKAIEKHDVHNVGSWIFTAEVRPEPNDGEQILGYYCACEERPAPRRADTVIPFGQAQTITGFNANFFLSDEPRKFYFNIYTSDDNMNWTLVELAGPVEKAIPEGESGHWAGKVDCYQTNPPLGRDPRYADRKDAGANCSTTIQVKFTKPVTAKYIKFANYGTDATKVFSVVNMEFCGEGGIIQPNLKQGKLWSNAPENNYDDNHNVIANMFDGDVTTRWVTDLFDCEI